VEPGCQTCFGECKPPFAAFWARLVRISCSLLQIFTSHNGNIYEEKVYITYKVGGPEIGAAHKSQKVGGPRRARPSGLHRQWYHIVTVVIIIIIILFAQ